MIVLNSDNVDKMAYYSYEDLRLDFRFVARIVGISWVLISKNHRSSCCRATKNFAVQKSGKWDGLYVGVEHDQETDHAGQEYTVAQGEAEQARLVFALHAGSRCCYRDAG